MPAPGNSECESALQTCDQIIRTNTPNLLRLYLNPFVAQTCVALAEMVPAIWSRARGEERRPSFPANSGHEALSGAVKLARYTQNFRSAATSPAAVCSEFSTNVFLVDNTTRYHHFSSTIVTGDDSQTSVIVEFIPEIHLIDFEEFILRDEQADGLEGILVLSPDSIGKMQTDTRFRRAVLRFSSTGRSIVIACIDRDRFIHGLGAPVGELVPDIVVFDESFTMGEIPFGAFTARRELAVQWMSTQMANFHSTTFQPNSVSPMHFLKCLRQHSSQFYLQLQPVLKPLLNDRDLLRDTLRDLFNPSLVRLISAAGYDQDDLSAIGHYIHTGTRRVFDGVGGVACSLRGHNPENWVREIRELEGIDDVRQEIQSRLTELTGLPHHLPAVSGASAVENAIKLALAAQPSRSTIVAFRGGFAGKTLVALAATSKSYYRQHLQPMYRNVVYLDPFADDAASQLLQIAEATPIALIQLELIQGVGGVRELPASLLEAVREVRKRCGAFLFIDEIQTGMFRTGAFVRSVERSLQPDLLTIGKGVSDMMVPFSMTLYADCIEQQLKARKSRLTTDLRERHCFELGYRALLNILRRIDRKKVTLEVINAGQRFHQELNRHLYNAAVVTDIRCYGLLIGIELNCRNNWFQRLGFRTAQLYLLQMMNHPTCPVLMGFCQYEPNILKFTPPLTVTDAEIVTISQAIAESLKTPPWRLLLTGISALWRSRK